MKITVCAIRIISELKPAKIACINIKCRDHSAKMYRPRNFCVDFSGGLTPVTPPPLNTGLMRSSSQLGA